MDHLGIDVHKRESQLCIITHQGEVIEKRIRTDRSRFAEVLGGRPWSKILLEASTESEWVAQCLEELGHEGIVADPNFAPMYGARTRRIKTDRRDARALADACMSGTYRAAHRTSERRRQLKAQLAVREALVRQRAKHIVLIGTLVRQQGLRVATGSANEFLGRLDRLALPKGTKAVLPLVNVLKTLNDQLKVTDANLARLGAASADRALPGLRMGRPGQPLSSGLPKLREEAVGAEREAGVGGSARRPSRDDLRFPRAARTPSLASFSVPDVDFETELLVLASMGFCRIQPPLPGARIVSLLNTLAIHASFSGLPGPRRSIPLRRARLRSVT